MNRKKEEKIDLTKIAPEEKVKYEIARELGRTPKTVDNAIQRIKKKVRACFET